MKRATALEPLAREHHGTLVLARRATRAGQAGTVPAELLDEVLHRWHEEIEPHFAVEERVLLPALVVAGATAAVEETLLQRARLRTAISTLTTGDAAALAAFGAALSAHVRYEDRELFPLAERLLELEPLAQALSSRVP